MASRRDKSPHPAFILVKSAVPFLVTLAFTAPVLVGCADEASRNTNSSETEVAVFDASKLSDPQVLACTKLIPEGLNPADPSVNRATIRAILGEETSSIKGRNTDLLYKRPFDFGESVIVVYNEQDDRYVSLNIFDPTAIQSYDHMVSMLGEPTYSNTAPADYSNYSYESESILNGRIVKTNVLVHISKDGTKVSQLSFLAR